MLHALRAAALALAVISGFAAAAKAEEYPVRPVRIIVGFGPGAAADITARLVAQRLGQTLGQQFVVENRPGAGSNIAAEYVTRAPKDGYTLFMATIANAINATFSPNLTFDFAKDLAPITLAATAPNVLAVNPSLGVKSVQELIALAKAKPDQILYGSSGIGTSTHLTGELFNAMAGIRLAHVPYPGSAQAVTDLLGGRIQVLVSPPSAVLPHVREGRLIALASTEKKRMAITPDLPTVAESGLPGFETGLWFGLLAPAGTPRPIIDKLSGAVNEALQNPEVVAPLRPQGIEPLGGSPDAFAAYIDSEIKKWAQVIAAAGLKK